MIWIRSRRQCDPGRGCCPLGCTHSAKFGGDETGMGEPSGARTQASLMSIDGVIRLRFLNLIEFF